MTVLKTLHDLSSAEDHAFVSPVHFMKALFIKHDSTPYFGEQETRPSKYGAPDLDRFGVGEQLSCCCCQHRTC